MDDPNEPFITPAKATAFNKRAQAHITVNAKRRKQYEDSLLTGKITLETYQYLVASLEGRDIPKKSTENVSVSEEFAEELESISTSLTSRQITISDSAISLFNKLDFHTQSTLMIQVQSVHESCHSGKNFTSNL